MPDDDREVEGRSWVGTHATIQCLRSIPFDDVAGSPSHQHFFDTIFLEAGGALADDGAAGTEGVSPRKPFGLWVHGRYDTTGAVRSVLGIVGALGWRQSAEVLEVLGEIGPQQQEAAYGLGGTVAALLMP